MSRHKDRRTEVTDRRIQGPPNKLTEREMDGWMDRPYFIGPFQGSNKATGSRTFTSLVFSSGTSYKI